MPALCVVGSRWALQKLNLRKVCVQCIGQSYCLKLRWSMETFAASVNVADEMKLMTVTFALKTTIGGRMTLIMTVTKSILIEHQ